MRHFLVLLLACLLGLPALASPATDADVIRLEETTPSPELTRSARYLIDSTGKATLEDLVAGRHSPAWQPFPGRELAAGYHPGAALWVRFRLDRRSGPTSWWVDAAWGFMDQITLHVIRPDGTLEVRHGGRAVPPSSREILWPGHAFRLELDQHGTYDVYLRYTNTGSLRIPLQLFSDRGFDHYRNRDTLLLGAFFGIMGLIGITSLLRGVMRRSAVEVCYGLYILSMETNNLVVSGWLQALGLLNGLPELRLTGAIATMTAVLALGAFVRYLISWPEGRLGNRLDRAIVLVVILYPVSLLLTAIVAPDAVTRLTNTVSGFLIIPVAALAIIAAIRNFPNARLFLFAFSPFLVSILIRWGQSLGIVPGHVLTQYAIILASLIHGIALLVVILIRDTAERERQKSLQWEIDALRAGIDNQALFMRMLAHEARTPLAVIDGQSQLLASGDASATEARQTAAHIRTAVRRVTNVLERFMAQDKLLGTAATPSGEIQASFDLVRLLQDIVAETQARTDHHLVALQGFEGKLVFSGDVALIRVMLQNLLDNAVNYSPDGGAIHVRLAIEGDRIVVHVSDEGVGISPDLREKIFEPYFRTGEVAEAVGSGLGLVLVRKIARLHGGDVRVSSEPGAGSTFTVSLPRR